MAIKEATVAVQVGIGVEAKGTGPEYGQVAITAGVTVAPTPQRVPASQSLPSLAVNAPVVVYTLSLKTAAYLPAAFDIAYEKRANEVWRAWFSIPLDYPHVAECTSRRYVELYDSNDRVGLFRIVKKYKYVREGNEYYRFECEHVLATLMDDQAPKTLYAGPGTEASIETVLALQGTANWKLGTCGFAEQYLYEWPRGTSLLEALLDIAERFQCTYLWTFDTSSHPWTLNLTDPSDTVTSYVDYGRNQKEIQKTEDARNLVTQLYPHGKGAGPDQVNITTVNPTGQPFLDSDTQGTYGVIVRHWADQRYETPQNLYDAASDLLETLKTPKITYSIKAVDLTRITGETIDRFTLGAVVSFKDGDTTVEARVMTIRKPDIEGKPGDITLDITNKAKEFDLRKWIRTNDLGSVHIKDIPGGAMGALPDVPEGAGIYICTDYLGYHDGSAWKTYIDIWGRFRAEGSGHHLYWNPTGLGTLDIKTDTINLTGAVNIIGTVMIQNLAVTTAKIEDLAVTDAKIDTLSVDKLTAGDITVGLNVNTGGSIKSNNYSAGLAGWEINADGSAEFQDVTIRGTLNASDLGAGTLPIARIEAGSITADKLYINEDINFAGDASLHRIYGVDALFLGSGGVGSNLYIGRSVGGDDLILNAPDQIWLQANSAYLWGKAGKVSIVAQGAGNDVEISSEDDITFLTADASAVLFLKDWWTTGGAQGTAAGRIQLISDGVTRYLRLYTD